MHSLSSPDAPADLFTTFMRPILDKEGRGRLTDNPADRGGLTIWGITDARARAAGYSGPLAAMTCEQAMAIYRVFYWQQPEFDLIADILPGLGRFMLDIGINCGTATPAKFLQRALNGLNNQASFFRDLAEDGHCGLMTRQALMNFRSMRSHDGSGDAVLLGIMRGLAVVHYLQIVENDPTMEAFAYGWIAARALA